MAHRISRAVAIAATLTFMPMAAAADSPLDTSPQVLPKGCLASIPMSLSINGAGGYSVDDRGAVAADQYQVPGGASAMTDVMTPDRSEAAFVDIVLTRKGRGYLYRSFGDPDKLRTLTQPLAGPWTAVRRLSRGGAGLTGKGSRYLYATTKTGALWALPVTFGRSAQLTLGKPVVLATRGWSNITSLRYKTWTLDSRDVQHDQLYALTTSGAVLGVDVRLGPTPTVTTRTLLTGWRGVTTIGVGSCGSRRLGAVLLARYADGNIIGFIDPDPNDGQLRRLSRYDLPEAGTRNATPL